MKRFSIKVVVVALVLSMTYPAAAAEIPAALRGVKHRQLAGEQVGRRLDGLGRCRCLVCAHKVARLVGVGLVSDGKVDGWEPGKARPLLVVVLQ